MDPSVNLPAACSVVGFVRSIAILALDAEGQVDWLQSLGLPGRAALADELALEFDDGFKLLPSFLNNGWLSQDIVGVVSEIDRALADMSGQANKDLWAVEALPSDPRWKEVRVLARKALVLIR